MVEPDQPTETDHRAEAVRLLRTAQVQKVDQAAISVAAAQVHATLACAPVGPAIDQQHVSEALTNARTGLDRALGELAELRAAVRAHLDDPERPRKSIYTIERLHGLVGGE